jgi:hypothetical protein
MTRSDAAKPRRAEEDRSIRAPAMGPAMAAVTVSEATRYEPVLALPRTAMVVTRSAGPADSAADRASVADAR